MKKLGILGLGKIGNYVAQKLDKSQFDAVNCFDKTTGYNFDSDKVLRDIICNHDGVLVCTPYSLNKKIASICNEYSVDYFDLTESVDVSEHVSGLKKSLFVPHCGLAPGMVNIIANHLASQFDTVRNIEIRVGALPQISNNQLRYYRTWSTEGLINEYCHPCVELRDGKVQWAEALVDQEIITIEGREFEAANTSGGVGTLVSTFEGRAQNVNYKTIRYPGHFQIMRFLKEELGMKENFQTFVELFNQNVPETNLDIVYVIINVVGKKNGSLSTKQYKRTIYCNEHETAIQIATGSGVLAVLDVWSQGLLDGHKGLLKQEQLNYQDIWNSRYAECYR